MYELTKKIIFSRHTIELNYAKKGCIKLDLSFADPGCHPETVLTTGTRDQRVVSPSPVDSMFKAKRHSKSAFL